MTLDEKIQLIGQKMMLLSNNLEKYKQELEALKQQLNVLIAEKNATSASGPIPELKLEPNIIPPVEIPGVNEKQPVEQIPVTNQEPVVEINMETIHQPVPGTKQTITSSKHKPKIPGISFEEKVGSRWLSIIGIVVLVLGIAIGVKYAIDEDLINETTRLVLGYLAGAVIMGFAVMYKKKYELFSAILLSGAMAVMYFTTFIGYSYYHFYTAPVAFVIMTIFTGFTVFAAHIYNREVVALIGLVGGYAVPPLLSTGSGEIQYMFGFMLILNSGILILSFIKYWRFVNHVAYALTWLIFAAWMASSYNAETYFNRTLFFATAFYFIFYTSFISYKVIRNKPFSAWDVILVLSNSFIYFGLGYNAMNHEWYERYQGLFCILNAVSHLGFAVYCKKKGITDKSIFHFIIALVITFITIAIPVQLEGNYVTFTWLSEMIILLWMAGKFNVDTYRKLGYVLSVLAFGSLVHDWTEYADVTRYAYRYNFKPLLNQYFITGVCAIAAYGVTWRLNKNVISDQAGRIANIGFIVISVLTAYITFANEINLYFDICYYLSESKHIGDYGQNWQDYDHSWRTYEALWMMMYTTVFVSIIGSVNLMKYKNRLAAYITWGFTLLIFFVNIAGGFSELSNLREWAVNYELDYNISTWNYNFRYVFLFSLALLLYMFYQYRNSELLSKIKTVNTWAFHFFLIVILSNQLTHFMVISHLDNYYHYKQVASRMGYTILWGLYSMALILYGILRKKKLLRIIALSLFALTLVKLGVDALSMTRGYQLIVFISIGVILLLVSFMYQKFKPLLFGDEMVSSVEQGPSLEPEADI
jgi:uncharacterized membrane protein